MPDEPTQAPKEDLDPELAQQVIKAIEEVEKEEAGDQSSQSTRPGEPEPE